MSVKCGKGHYHDSVAEVRKCYGVSGTTTQVLDYKSNQYPGNCRLCGAKVEAEQGRVDKIDGKWLTSHLDGKCPQKPPLRKVGRYRHSGDPAWESADGDPQGYGDPADRYAAIPVGHYATGSLTGHNDLDFWRVDRPEQGKYAGRTFVKRIVGGKPDLNVSRETKFAALEAILEIGTELSAALYGQKLGRCSRCNRHLTDELSRKFGMGPECRSKR